ncbi:MAG: tripartite tricarboxylate transporter substrate binding protein [Enhydrobacter sp.]|nr:tripartite tricarboxylate transporter substrate binding protein [Enhydrobacter sp.]
MRLTRRAILAAGTLLAARPALAEENLRIVVPFGAGSGTDNTMRVFAEAYREATGRTVIVDNKPGGGTTIGSLEVSRAKPDGSTVLYTTGGHTSSAVLIRKLPYDPIEGFTPITLLVRSQGFGLMVSGKSPFKTLDQFLAAARAEPGKLTYGSSGIGNTTHLVGELFCRSAHVQLTHVPYKTTPIQDAIVGTIDSFFVSPSLVIQYLQAGTLRMLGISSPKRMPQFPDVPTFGEFGIEADIPAWSGFWGPAKLPAPIVDQLYATLMKAAHEKRFEDYVRGNGGEVVGEPPAKFAAYVSSEIERYRRILPPLGIQTD